jgi:hypothetical protein
MKKSRIAIQLTKVHGRRSACGSGIAEGVVATWLIVSVAVAVLLLLINVGLIILSQQKVTAVAMAAAKHLANGRYWVGMERNDFNANKGTLEAEAKTLAEDMIVDLGWKRSDLIWKKPTYTPVMQGGARMGWITRVNFDVKNVQLMKGVAFPSVVAIPATGISAETATRPYCVGVLSFTTTTPPLGMPFQTVVFPAYYPLTSTSAGTWRQYAFAKPGYPMGEHNYSRVFLGAINANPIYPANPQGAQVQDPHGNPVAF